MGGKGGIRGRKRKGALRLACIMWGEAQGGLYSTEKTSSDSTASYYADGQ